MERRSIVNSIAALCVLVSLALYTTYSYLNKQTTRRDYYKEQSLLSTMEFENHPSIYGHLPEKDEHMKEPQIEKRSNWSMPKTTKLKTPTLNSPTQTYDLTQNNNRQSPQTQDSVLAKHKVLLNPPAQSSVVVQHKQEQKQPAQGYVLAEDFWEQLSSASRNMQNLQCWAKKIGLKVVEPFATNSVLRTPLAPPKFNLRFSDLIDLESWNRESRKNGNEEIVRWETFLREAPKDVIAVEFNYLSSGDFVAVQKEVKKNPTKYPPREVRYKQCPSEINEWPKQQLLEKMGFRIVRTACLNFAYADQLTLEEFNTGIYDTLDPSTTTVYFKKWKGLSSFGRIPVKESGCYNTGIQENMPASPKLVRDARIYISKYLTGRSYIAIIARLEKSKIASRNTPGIVEYCMNQTLEQWNNLTSKSGLTTTFLSIDMGKYGSNSFRYDNGVQKDFERFFRSVYDGGWSISDWERSFEDVGGTTDAGYIALLQKIIVTQARCVLFVGGGSFQRHALSLYQARVPESEWCLDVVKKCTSKRHLPSMKP